MESALDRATTRIIHLEGCKEFLSKTVKEQAEVLRGYNNLSFWEKVALAFKGDSL